MLSFKRQIVRVLSTGLLFAVCCGKVDASVIGYWRFEEGSGTTSVDSSGNGNIASLSNGAQFVNDVGANPIPLTGLTNNFSLGLGGSKYAEVGPSGILAPTTAITVEAWVNRQTAGTLDAGIVGRQYGTDNKNSYNLFTRTNQTSVGFEITNSSGGTAAAEVFSSPFELDRWYHVAGVYDGSEIRLYIDGVLKANTSFSGDIGYARENRVLIGVDNEGTAFNPQYFFPGFIDEVRINDAALSTDQFLNANPVPEPATIAVWSIVGLCGVGYGLRRKMRKTS